MGKCRKGQEVQHQLIIPTSCPATWKKEHSEDSIWNATEIISALSWLVPALGAERI
jgi:hypothetical protein